MTKKNILLTLLLIIVFLPSGCIHNVPPIDSTLPQKPLIEKLPITVGIYYDDEFRSFQRVNWAPVYTRYGGYPSTSTLRLRINLGHPNVILFDQIFSEMFEKVIQVDNLPPLSQVEHDINAVIKPKVWDPRIIIYNTIPIFVEVKIDYTITLYDLNGAQIAYWSIRGLGSSERYFGTFEGMVREAVQIAMQEVAAQFFAGFCNQHDIKKLFDKECNQ